MRYGGLPDCLNKSPTLSRGEPSASVQSAWWRKCLFYRGFHLVLFDYHSTETVVRGTKAYFPTVRGITELLGVSSAK
jgi:hypothetical protein